MSRRATPWEALSRALPSRALSSYVGAYRYRNVLHHRGGRGLADAYGRNVMVALTYALPEEP